ncbi:MAG: hypothetical protein FD181_3747 [Prolixibacteraceae bacterium]|nr:MAG: hypothetical protein FD181_3747 [Prolixibacteraceae bacterium]
MSRLELTGSCSIPYFLDATAFWTSINGNSIFWLPSFLKMIDDLQTPLYKTNHKYRSCFSPAKLYANIQAIFFEC